MKLFTVTICSLIVLISTFCMSANASETFYACKQPCTNLSTQAKNIAHIKNPGDIFSIINADTLTATTYRGKLVYIWGEPFVVAEGIPTSNEASQKVVSVKNWKTAMKQVNITIPVSLPGISIPTDSAFGLVATPSMDAFVGQYITSNLGVIDTTGATVGGYLQILGKLVDFKAIITVRFSDGTTYDFTVVGFDTGGLVFGGVAGSGLSVEGIKIPGDASDFIGTHPFSNMGSVNGFAALSGLWGVTFKSTANCTDVPVITCSDVNGDVVCSPSSVLVCP
jgi:hypothetical protein